MSINLCKLSDWVIPQTISSGCFGPGSQIIKYERDSTRKGEDQFASTVEFLEIVVKLNDCVQKFNVVIKFHPNNQIVCETLRTPALFKNEIYVYSKLFPMIDQNGIISEIFPEYYNGVSNCNGDYILKDFVMLEDLSKNHYRLSNEKVFLDYDHCALALKEIGRFHALSYAAKKQNLPMFLDAVSHIVDKWDVNRLSTWKEKFLFCGNRAVLPLIGLQKYDEILKDFLKNYNDIITFYTNLVKPIEPEAVLCHGDFCRNNMIFSYNDDGKPISVKFFDLQTPRYSSPVIDLSFFLLMNTSNETRELYWDDLLDVYKHSVKSVFPDIEIPEFNFARVAIYGFLHCSFFLPLMLAPEDGIPVEDFLKLSLYEQAVQMSTVGGEKGTQCIVDIVRFLLKKNYIQHSYY